MLHLLNAFAAPTTDDPARSFHVDYEVQVPRAVGKAPVDLFLPLPTSDPQQQIEGLTVTGPVDGEIGVESMFGNHFWHGTLRADQTPTTVHLGFDVHRRTHRVDPSLAATRPLTAEERHEHRRHLQATSKVPVGEIPALAPLLRDVRETRADDSPGATARAIYDWVSTHMEYKKVGTGWGNGDTSWACSSLYGNCTDFHSVFLSLARTEHIPATFEIGFPIPLDRPHGEIAGYHCWVQFWLPEVGWVPIDASEASKHPDEREGFYGGHPADRVRFTTGRDLRLGTHHRGAPLNYFIYPYAERDGKSWTVQHQFSYREL